MCLHSGHGNMLTLALPISWALRRVHISAGRKSLADGTLYLFKYTVTQCWCRYSGYSLQWYMHTTVYVYCREKVPESRPAKIIAREICYVNLLFARSLLFVPRHLQWLRIRIDYFGGYVVATRKFFWIQLIFYDANDFVWAKLNYLT